jgi:hypothetical protein
MALCVFDVGMLLLIASTRPRTSHQQDYHEGNNGSQNNINGGYTYPSRQFDQPCHNPKDDRYHQHNGDEYPQISPVLVSHPSRIIGTANERVKQMGQIKVRECLRPV